MAKSTKKLPIKRATSKATPKKTATRATPKRAVKKTATKKATPKRSVAKRPTRAVKKPVRKTTSRTSKLSGNASAKLDDVLFAYESMKEEIIDSIGDIVEDTLQTARVGSATAKAHAKQTQAISDINENLYDIADETAYIRMTLDDYIKKQQPRSNSKQYKKNQEQMSDTIALALAKLSKKKVTRNRVASEVLDRLGVSHGTNKSVPGVKTKNKNKLDKINDREKLGGSSFEDPFQLVGYHLERYLSQDRMKRVRSRQSEAARDSVGSSSAADVIKSSKARRRGLNPLNTLDAMGDSGAGIGLPGPGDVAAAAAGAKAIYDMIKKGAAAVPETLGNIMKGVGPGWLGTILTPAAAALTMEVRKGKITPEMRKKFEEFNKKKADLSYLHDLPTYHAGFMGSVRSGKITPEMKKKFEEFDKNRRDISRGGTITPDMRKKFEEFKRKKADLGPLRDLPSYHAGFMGSTRRGQITPEIRDTFERFANLDKTKRMTFPPKGKITPEMRKKFEEFSRGSPDLSGYHSNLVSQNTGLRKIQDMRNYSGPMSSGPTGRPRLPWNGPSVSSGPKGRPRLPYTPMPQIDAKEELKKLAKIKVRIPNRRKLQKLIYLLGELSKVQDDIKNVYKNSFFPEMADSMAAPLKDEEARLIQEILQIRGGGGSGKSSDLSGGSSGDRLTGSAGGDTLSSSSSPRPQLPSMSYGGPFNNRTSGGKLAGIATGGYDSGGGMMRPWGGSGLTGSGGSSSSGGTESYSPSISEPYKMPGGPLAGSTVGGMITGGVGPKVVSGIPAEGKAFLDGIASVEGGKEGYYAINYKAGGGRTNSLQSHPFTGRKGYTAAGRYQMLASNFERISKKLKLDGTFSEANQDAVAWDLAKTDYKQRTGRELQDDLKDPSRRDGVMKVLGPTWIAFKSEAARRKASKAMDTSMATARTEGTAASSVRLNGSPIQSTSKNDGKSRVKENQASEARTRKQPINPKVKNILEYAAAQNGVQVEVFSGGQARKGSGGPRTGSVRHDEGNAADVRLFRTVDGKKVYLDMRNPDDQKVMSNFAKASASAGATGIGAAPNYMGPNAMHVGLGTKQTWGAGGDADKAPEWLKKAVQEGWKSPVDLDNWVRAQDKKDSHVQNIDTKSVPLTNRTLGSIKSGTFGMNEKVQPAASIDTTEQKKEIERLKRQIPEQKAVIQPPEKKDSPKPQATTPAPQPIPISGGSDGVPPSYRKAVQKSKNQEKTVAPATNSQGITSPFFA
jgi:muramidase (phage lysozyme)